MPTSTLLAVDLGLRTGLALFDAEGRLVWYRSQNFGSRARLKRGAYGLLAEIDGLAYVVIEGGGDLATIWEREAERRNAHLLQIQAGTWRRRLMLPREQRTASDKSQADVLARQVIDWSGAARPTSLRHDAAEAILIGLWAVLEVGWLDTLPPRLQR